MPADPGPDGLPALVAATAALRDVLDASRELTTRVSEALRLGSTDVTALYLLEVHGPLGVAALARRLGIRTASATALVDRLAAAGHVERAADPADRRRTSVVLREDARAANLAAWLPVVSALDDVARSMPAADQEVVTAYLTRARAVLDEHPAPAS